MSRRSTRGGVTLFGRTYCSSCRWVLEELLSRDADFVDNPLQRWMDYGAAVVPDYVAAVDARACSVCWEYLPAEADPEDAEETTRQG